MGLRLTWAALVAVSMLGACGHDLEPLRYGWSGIGMDAGLDAREDAPSADTSVSPVCNETTCTTDLPCHDARCEGDLCMIEPGCARGEECCAGSCVPAGCSDGVDCTTDSCEVAGCVNMPNDTLCLDAADGTCDPSTGCQYSVCDGTTCASSGCETARCEGDTCVRESTCGAREECCGDSCVPVGCDDDNLCTDDSCEPSGCVNSNNSAPCDDGVMCNGADTCAGGSCSAHDPSPAENVVCGATPNHRCCDGACTDTKNNPRHCGACGNDCGVDTCTNYPDGAADTCFCTTGRTCPSGFSCRVFTGAFTVGICSCNAGSSCTSDQTCEASGGGVSLCRLP